MTTEIQDRAVVEGLPPITAATIEDRFFGWEWAIVTDADGGTSYQPGPNYDGLRKVLRELTITLLRNHEADSIDHIEDALYATVRDKAIELVAASGEAQT